MERVEVEFDGRNYWRACFVISLVWSIGSLLRISYSGQISLGDLLSFATLAVGMTVAIFRYSSRRAARKIRIERIVRKLISLSSSDIEILNLLVTDGAAREDRLRKAIGGHGPSPVSENLKDSGLILHDGDLWTVNPFFLSDVPTALKQRII